MDKRCGRWDELGYIPDYEMRELLSKKSDQDCVMKEIFCRCPDLVTLNHFSMIDEFENSKIDPTLFILICEYKKIDMLLYILSKIDLNLIIEKINQRSLETLFANNEIMDILFANGMIPTHNIYKYIIYSAIEIQKNFIKNMLKMNYSIGEFSKIWINYELIHWVVENYFQQITLDEKIAHNALIIILDRQSVSVNFVEKFVVMGANLSLHGDYFFIRSCKYCQKDVVLFFLEYSNINALNGGALRMAMDFENDQIVELLLTMEIIITENLIKSTHNDKHIKLLIKYGADINLVAKILFERLGPIFGFLVENGVDLNQIALLKN